MPFRFDWDLTLIEDWLVFATLLRSQLISVRSASFADHLNQKAHNLYKPNLAQIGFYPTWNLNVPPPGVCSPLVRLFAHK